MSPSTGEYRTVESDSQRLKPIVALLGGAQVLHQLSEEARVRLARAGSAVDLDAGATLCQAGDPGDAVYVILEGEVEILTRSSDGQDVRISALGPGAIIGEMAVLDGGPRSADMVASHRCKLYRIPRGALLDVLRSDSDAAVELIIELSRRLRASNATLEATMRLGLAGRLAWLITQSMNAKGLVALTQTEMARRLGASREKVNRKLHEWQDGGLVEITPAGVRTLSADGLRDVISTSKRR